MDHSTITHKGKGTDAFPTIVTPVSRHAHSAQHSVPTHVPHWMMIVHPLLTYVLNFCVSPGFSLGKLLVLVAYSLIMLYTCLYHSNLFAKYNCTGYIAVSQVTLIMALTGKLIRMRMRRTDYRTVL